MQPNETAPLHGKKIVLFGATSEIAGEIALRLAAGNHLILAGRRVDALEQLAHAVRTRGAASVEVLFFDADDVSRHRECIALIEASGPIDIALAMFGILGNQATAEVNGEEVRQILHTDFTAQAVLLTELAATMRLRNHGLLVAYSSIAGARVRRPNYVYGSAKAGLDGFCQGMQDALAGLPNSLVSLIIVRPGFVIGRMTEGMDPAPFSSTPAEVAAATVAAIVRGMKKPGTQFDVWVPGKLRWVAALMHMVPRWLWRRAPR